MNQIIETLASKVDKQETLLQELDEKVKAIPDSSGKIVEIWKEMHNTFLQHSLPKEEVVTLTAALSQNIRIMKTPPTENLIHHHHLSKVIFIVIVLVIVIAILGTGWYNTADSLKEYKEADTKYRFLKLQESRSIQQLLITTDSLYYRIPTLRDSVLRQEQLKNDRLEMLRLATEQEQSARELRRKAGERNRQ
ncbi:hypothetical protein [Chitinophaga arvensicola]|uniref:Uncharacterized protein n=1 Tax=Chitinophaga arvensicola TaxID=29529 RepID=A0A1I0SDS3_9BACT|nr:hypothetical protein [Chitinophaga arvensicola]SEW56436.1 hypothetical protein SAMN04488122_6666 [Chitinophaga arvensicola]